MGSVSGAFHVAKFFAMQLAIARCCGQACYKYPPPPCISYTLVQATVGVGTVLIWDLILIWYQT